MKASELTLNNIKPNKTQPNKHVMALITFVLLLPLVYFIPEFIATYMSDDRFFVSLISVGVIVPLLSYLLIPLILKLCFK